MKMIQSPLEFQLHAQLSWSPRGPRSWFGLQLVLPKSEGCALPHIEAFCPWWEITNDHGQTMHWDSTAIHRPIFSCCNWLMLIGCILFLFNALDMISLVYWQLLNTPPWPWRLQKSALLALHQNLNFLKDLGFKGPLWVINHFKVCRR